MNAARFNPLPGIWRNRKLIRSMVRRDILGRSGSMPANISGTSKGRPGKR